ncbi:AAA family ATPase [Kribbella sp. NPDC059898]|uniref:AAA family ATPase n=1 Tax=Kribbella sp. NPDC059898 TaxID=3346995 RepID=UPI00365CF1F5
MTVIDACGRAGVPVLLLGDPGIGKSSLVRGIAANEGLLCETVLGSIREPADLAGLPVVTPAGVVLDPPAWAKRLAAENAGYLFLDELTTCPDTVQAAMLAVTVDRTVGDLHLGRDVRIVAGANPPDTAAGGYELAAPLANRFCHVPYAPTTDEWIDGETTGWSAPPTSRAIGADDLRRATLMGAVTTFIRTRPELLHALPKDADGTGGAWPSRRTWSMLARSLAHVRDGDDAAVQVLVLGLVGEGAGTEFLKWRQEMDLPTPDAVVADPSIVAWNGRPDRVWAVLSAVVAWAASRGSVQAWREAWGPMVAAAENGAADVAVAAARTHIRARPPRATWPASVRKALGPVLEAAGLTVAPLSETAADVAGAA